MDQISKNIGAGVIISLSGILVGVIIALIIKMISQDVSIVTILFYRFTFSLPILLCFACYTRGKEFYKIKNKRVMFLRIIFGLAGLIFWILAIRSLPLGLATALFHSSVIFVSFLAPFFLSEKTTAKRLLASIFGLLGVILLTDPISDKFSIYVTYGLASAICGACLSIFLRKLGQSDNPASVALIYNFFGAAITALITTSDTALLVIPNQDTLLLLILLGVLVSVTQILLTSAYYFLDAIIVSCLGYLRVPASAFAAYILVAETLSKTEVIGAVVVVLSSVLILISPKKITV
tara:strand:- start:55 stop:933 length:879 start_codon:yes stop_codon:yes gene_type:complete